MGLPTEFTASDAFLNKWADAQKLAYSQGAGWIVSPDEVIFYISVFNVNWSCVMQYWNFKIEISPEAGDLARHGA